MITILYIDDEPALLEIGKRFLERSGEFQIITAVSGEEALGIIRSRPVDAIVSDYQMPEMDGISLLKEIRSRYPDLPFVLFTGKGREEVVIEAIDNGADFYLQKGGDPKAQFAELEHKISQAVRRSAAEANRRLNEVRLNAMIHLFAIRNHAQKEITDYALEQAVVITQSKLGYLAFLTEDEKVLMMHSWSKNAMAECRISDKVKKYPVEKTGLWGEAVRQRRPIITNDYAADNPFKKGIPRGHVALERHMNVPVFDGDRIVIVVGVANKVTEYNDEEVRQLQLLMNALWGIIRRKRVEEALAASGERFRSLIQNSSDIIVILDNTGCITYSSPSFHRLLGYPEGSELGRPALEYVHSADRGYIIQELKEVYNRQNTMVPTQYRLLKSDGGYIYAESVGVNLTDVPGVSGIVITTRDITERKRKELELQAAYEQIAASEEELRENFEELMKRQDEIRILAQFPAQNPNPVMRVDSRGILVYANPASDRILNLWGIARESNIPESLSEKIAAVIKDGVLVSFETIIDGSRYLVTAAPVPKEPFANIYFLDITDRSRAEEAVARRNEELQAAYQQLSATDRVLRDNYRLITEKQKTLEENEEKYRNLFEAESDAIFLIDNDSGKILEANTSASHLYGYSREELLTKTNADLSAEPDQTRTFTQGTPVDFSQVVTVPRRWHKKKGGIIFPVEITGRFFFWQNRAVHIAAVRDVTARQNVEDEEKRRTNRSVRYHKALVHLATTDTPTLRSALHRITEAGSEILSVERASIWFMSSRGDVLVCNDLYTHNRNAHESGQEISSSHFPAYFSALHENRAIVAPQANTHEHTREFKEGYLDVWGVISMLAVPIRSGKEVIGVLCFEKTDKTREWDIEDQDFAGALADYTAIVLEQARRHLLEKDLKKSEEKYRAVVDRANDGIAIIQSGSITFANPKAAEIFGYAPKSLTGTMFLELVAPSDRPLVKDRYQRRKNGEDVPSVYDITMLNKAGQPIAVELNAGIISFEGRPADLIFIRDISERKRSEQAIRLANQKLNLLSSVTRHDILNKLTIVIGYLELAKMTHDREKLEDFIRKIDAILQVMEEQIQFTHDYQDMGVKEPEWQDTARIFDLAASQLDFGTIKVENRLSGLSIYADPLLTKVFYNILDNALRYGGKVTEISARYRQSDGRVIVEIEDNGMGISSKNKSRIFEKGFGHHTGLGLFLVKEILSLTNIEIMETGFPEKGALFEIHVPAGKYRIAG